MRLSRKAGAKRKLLHRRRPAHGRRAAGRGSITLGFVNVLYDSQILKAGPGRPAGNIRVPQHDRSIGVEVASIQVTGGANAVVAEDGANTPAPADAGYARPFSSAARHGCEG